MSINNQSRIQRRKKRNRRKWLYLLIPLVLILAAGGYWIHQVLSAAEAVIKESYENDGREKSIIREKQVDPDIDNVSILIMGVDENPHRDNKGSSRTDALIYATFNKNENSIKLLSIPRDSYVYIPDLEKKDKINHAHFFGGPISTVETVENLLGVPVDYWVTLDFSAFVQIVDALGGVEVEVPYEFKESDSMDRRDTIHLYPGLQTLNGEEALAFARTRKHDNDVERGKRQLEIIKSILNKTVSLQAIPKYVNMIGALEDNITMNMKKEDITSFISYGLNMKNLTIESHSLEGEDLWLNGIYYWQVDEEYLAAVSKDIMEHLEIETEELSNEQTDFATEEDDEDLIY